MDLSAITIRGLTRRELRQLEAEGVSLGEIKTDDYATVDRVLSLGCAPVPGDFDALTPAETLELFGRVMDATFVPERDRKNSVSPRS